MKKLLIVDDDVDLLEMAHMALTEEGFEVCALEEGKLLFAEIQRFHPDVILLDVFLRDADGRDLCYQLKSDPLYKHIPVALYSAGHMSHETIVDSKADMYITKPFDIMQLGEKLRSILAKRTNINLSERYLDFILQYIPLYGFKSRLLVKS